MLANYFPILVFFIIGIILGVLPLIIARIISIKKPDPAKIAPYECGFAPFGDARAPFDIRFYLVAILFIIFDLETAFLFPWAVCFKKIGTFGLVAMGIFLALLTIGFIYEWKKGALEWE